MSRFYTDVFKRGNKVFGRFIDNDTGNRTLEEIPFKPFLFLKSNNPTKVVATGLRGEPLERIDFGDVNEFEDFQERYKDTEGFKMYGCRDVTYQYIASHFKGKIDYSFQHVRGAIVDIEVESGDVRIDPETKQIVEIIRGPFPEPADANYPINAVTIYDTKTKTFYSLGLETFNGAYLGTYKHNADHPKVGHCKVVYKGYQTERELLVTMMTIFEKAQPDFISGWNSNSFDIVYIINRVKKVLGDDWAKKISPWNIIRQRTFTGSFGREEINYEVYGVAALDYKDLVDKHAYVELANKRLNTAGEHFLGESKISYDEAKNLTTLYFTNYQKYMEYNIHDVNLIVRMEAKLKFFELVYTLAYMFHCNPADTMGTVQPWSAMTYEKLHNRGEEPELKPVFGGDTTFLGGYVQEPKPGLYKWVVSIDAQSLYPHMIMQFNLGQETILTDQEAYKVRMMIVDELNQVEQTPYIMQLKQAIREGRLLHDLYWQDAYEFKTLKELNLIMAPNCSFYRRDKVSVFAEFCDEIYAGRKIVKKQMLKHEQELVDLKASGNYTQADVERLEALISSMHNLQQGYKIAMNSLFGAMGNKWFREYYDIRVAEAITSAGQTGIQYMSRRLDEHLRAKVGDNKAVFSFYNDTDSVYMTLDAWVQANYTKEQQEDYEFIIHEMDLLVGKEIEPLLIQWATELADALNCPHNKLIFKREALSTSGIWVSKKRYALMVLDNEGVRYPKPKLKFTGLEAKKSDYPSFCREWLKECYEIALTRGEVEIQERVKSIKTSFMSKEIHEIAAPKSVNDIEKWVEPGTFNTIKGAPSQVKAAVNYNFMLNNKGLSLKPIVSGDKLLHVPLKKGAPHGMGIIGFPDFLPEEFDLVRWVDKNESFDKFFISPLTNFIKAVGWSHEPRASVMDFFA